MRTAIVDLFERARARIDEITSGEQPGKVLVVLVSRRLSCVYAMLLDAGMPPLDEGGQCEVVFDRALDGNLGWRGSHALVLDDMLIYGQTMADRYKEVRETFSGNSGTQVLVEPMVAAIYEGARGGRMEMLWPNGMPEGVPRYNSEQNAQFSEDLSYCLYRSTTPYFTDFPIIGTGRLRNGGSIQLKATQKEMKKISTTSDEWLATDVTLKPPIGTEGQVALSFFPTNETADKIRNKMSPAAAALAELMKVRVFAGAPDGEGNHILRIVPIGVPGPASPATLDHAIEQIADDVTDWGISDWDSWKPQGRHRLVQMYISTAVAGEFWKRVESIKGIDRPLCSDLLDEDHISGYFEQNRVEGFRRTFDSILKRYSSADPEASEPLEAPVFAARPTSAPYELNSLRLEVAEKRWKNMHRSDKFGTPPSRPANKKKAVVDPMWAHDLLNLWAVIVNEHQRPAQEQMADDSEAAEGETARWYERVRCGFLPSELTEAVLGFKEAEDTWDKGLVSLVLDMGNDLGIAVPSTHNQADHPFGGQLIYRQYRAGENAPAAKSRLQDLAKDNPEEVYQNIDPFLRCLMGISAGTPWDDLTHDQKARVSDLADASIEIEAKTTEKGSLTAARLATVVNVDEENGKIEVQAEGPALEDLDDWVEIPIEMLGREIVDRLQPDLQFYWYTIEPGEGDERAEEFHRFELLTNTGTH